MKFPNCICSGSCFLSGNMKGRIVMLRTVCTNELTDTSHTVKLRKIYCGMQDQSTTVF